MTTHGISKLPEGYSFAYRLEPVAIVSLLDAHYPPDPEETQNDWLQKRCEASLEGGQHIDVGVYDTERQLVGYGGVTYMGLLGAMGALVVDAEHRGRGIARALIDKRIGLATARGIDILGVQLGQGNPLRSFYEERGFRLRENGWLQRVINEDRYNRLMGSMS